MELGGATATTGRHGLRVGELALGLGVLALGLFIAVETWRLGPAVGAAAAVGPRLFPAMVAAGLIIVGVLLLREALAGRVAHEGGIALDWLAVALVTAGLIAEMFLLERLGWIPAAAVLFVLAAAAFGSRRFLVDIAIGVGLAALTYFVFSYTLDLSLPVGTVVEEYLAPAEEAAPGGG